MSFESTSSFFTTSPWTFVSPAMPYLKQTCDKKNADNKPQIRKSRIEGSEWLSLTQSITAEKTIETYSCAIPAFLTAELMALTAVWMLFKSWDKSPVACWGDINVFLLGLMVSVSWNFEYHNNIYLEFFLFLKHKPCQGHTIGVKCFTFLCHCYKIQ